MLILLPCPFLLYSSSFIFPFLLVLPFYREHKVDLIILLMSSLQLQRERKKNKTSMFILFCSVPMNVSFLFSLILKFGTFCGFSLYYVLIQWFCVAFSSIFLYCRMCPQCSPSQHEQYSQKEFEAELPGVLQENFHREGNEAKKQWHCLNKLIDLRHGFGGGKFHYYLLLN